MHRKLLLGLLAASLLAAPAAASTSTGELIDRDAPETAVAGETITIETNTTMQSGTETTLVENASAGEVTIVDTDAERVTEASSAIVARWAADRTEPGTIEYELDLEGVEPGETVTITGQAGELEFADEIQVVVTESVDYYTNGAGEVTIDELRTALEDWRGDKITTGLLLDVIAEWR